MNTNRTLAELNAAVQSEMQLDPGLISAVERTQFLNDCLADLGRLSGFNKWADLSVVDGLASLPDDFVDIIAVLRDTTWLRPISISDMSTGYIVLYNILQTTPSDTETLRLYYSYRPAKMVLDASKPDIPNGYDNLLVDYAVARAHRKNGNLGVAREYMASYDEQKFMLLQALTKLENSHILNTINSETVINNRFGDEDILL